MTDPNTASARVLELADEFLERYRQGQRPGLGEYTARHPELAGEIREVFPAMAMMERIALVDEPIGDGTTPPAPGPPPRLRQLGDYRILREIGHGGMGVVYEAEQVSLGRHVALKVLPERLLRDPKQRRRFEREAKAAARLHHTNIVPVFGVGEHDGTPYYAMQFIPGLGLDQVLDELKRQRGRSGAVDRVRQVAPAGRESMPTAADVARTLLEGGAPTPVRPASAVEPETRGVDLTDGGSAGAPPPSRVPDPSPLSSSSASLLGLGSGSDPRHPSGSRRPTYWQGIARVGSQVADALAYAHSQGVLHRDIKPSNLLLDARGVVWVADFGLAKVDDRMDLTHTGDILGTLRYMPPEGFEGRHDARGDVYSLGLSLYEMLAFRPAFDESERGRLIRQVTSGEPPRLRTLNPDVPRDLETVVHKAIERDPSHRYATAADLAEDLRRYVEDRPILARRASESEKFRRWCRRNPAPAGLLATLLLVFWAGFGLVAWKWREAVAEREEKDTQRLKAVASERDAGLARDRAEKASKQALLSAERAGRSLYYSQIARARLEQQACNVAEAEAILDRCEPTRRGWEWHFLKGLDHAELFELKAHDGWVARVAYSPDGRLIASAGGGNPFYFGKGPSNITPGRVILWDAETGRPARTLEGHAHLVLNVAFSPDGRAVASASLDGTTRLHDVATGRLLRSWGGGKVPFKSTIWVEEGVPLAFSPDGRRLAMAMADRTVALWDVSTGSRALTLPADQHGYDQVLFSPDGRWIATMPTMPNMYGRIIRLWDATSGAGVARPENDPAVSQLAFSPDSLLLAGANLGGNVSLWEVPSGKFLRVLNGNRGLALSVAFSPDGRTLAIGGEDTTVRICDKDSGQTNRIIRGHTSIVTTVAFSPDGERLVTGSRDGTARAWDLSRDPEIAGVCGEYANIQAISYAAGGRHFAEFDMRGKVIRHESGSHVPLGVRVTGVEIGHASPAELACFDGQGRRVVAVRGRDRLEAECIGAGGVAGRVVLRGHRLPILMATLSADGLVAATGSFAVPASPAERGGEVVAWDAVGGRPLFRWGSGREQPRRVALDARGRLLAISAVRDGTSFFPDGPESVPFLVVFDVAAGREVFRQDPLAEPCMALGFSPDGRRLAAAGFNRGLWTWDLEAGRMVASSNQAPELPLDLAFSPDGLRLAVASRQQVQLMDAETGDEVLTLRGEEQQRPHDRAINPRVRFSTDGTRILAICGEGRRGVSEWVAEPAGFVDLASRVLQARRRGIGRLFDRFEHFFWFSKVGDVALAASLARMEGLALETAPQFLRRAGAFVRQGRVDRAEADFARAAALAPGDEQVAFAASRGLAWADRWESARGYVDLLGGRVPIGFFSSEPTEWAFQAAIHAMAGDQAGYRWVCRELVERHGQKAQPAWIRELARACSLAPHALDNPAEMVRLAERARTLARETNDPAKIAASLADLGAARERAGDPEEAERLERRSLGLRPDGVDGLTCRFRLAVALRRQGRRDEARACLVEADRLASDPARGVPGGAGSDSRPPGFEDHVAWWKYVLARREAVALVLDDGIPADPFAR